MKFLNIVCIVVCSNTLIQITLLKFCDNIFNSLISLYYICSYLKNYYFPQLVKYNC